MDVEDVEARLKKFIVMATNEKIRIDDIRPDVALIKGGLALDSVAVLQLLVAIEGEFGILLDDSALTAATFESVGTLARFVQAQRAAQTPR